MPRFVRQLRAWQFREWLYSACVAAAGFLLLVVLGISAACLIDFLIDRRTDTPFWVRLTLAIIQLLVYGLAALWIVRRLKAPSLVSLAMRAERMLPRFGHRLVTTMQLTAPGARTQGMSQELIAVVSVEAEELAGTERLPSLASKRRLGIALMLLAPVVVIGALAFLVWEHYTIPLLQRQCLMNAAIPHPLTVEDLSASLWPSGDAVELRFRVRGPNADNLAGTISVWPKKNARQYLPREQYEAKFVKKHEDDGSAEYSVQIPPSTLEFDYRARFYDRRWYSLNHGRMPERHTVHFEPRPVVNSISAWAILPAYVDPEGKKRYEQVMPQAEVSTHPDSSVRVSGRLSKPVETATLILHGRDETGNQVEQKRLPMILSTDREEAEIIFDLENQPFAYAIEIRDSNGFTNLSPPRRGINILPDAPPRVELLDEVLRGGSEYEKRRRGDSTVALPDEAFEIRGCPIPQGGVVQLGYRARSPLGISEAALVYRINDGPWSFLKLQRVVADESRVGRFEPHLGIFAEYGVFQAVEFYLIPSTDPDSEPDGLAAGGRYNFQVASMTKFDNDGNRKPIVVGDRVEFYVVAYDRKPGLKQDYTDRMGPGRPPGASESRIKTIVSETQYREWENARLQSHERLRRLEELQRGVFGQKLPR